MRVSPLSPLAFGLGLASLVDLASAIPTPKMSSVRRPGYRGPLRRSGGTIIDQVAETASYPTVTAPKANPWLHLSNDEAASVIAYLHEQADLNLTAVADAGDWDNTIMVVDLAAPPKADVLAYLDGDGAAPARYAIASLLFGATDEPYAQDFRVGPLPIGDDTTHVPNTLTSTSEDAKIRVYDLDSPSAFLVEQSMLFKDIINDLLNATIETSEDLENTFDIWGSDPIQHETDEHGNDRAVYWGGFWRLPGEVEFANSTTYFDGGTLLPQGLYLKADITGRDQSKWSLMGILYADEYYTSIDDFRSAWEKPGFNKLTPNYSGDWVGTDKTTGDALPLETLPPPQQVQPAGQRFKVDADQKYVEWMDFTFYLTYTRDTGIRLFDIKYKGERVLYELGLQEAIAHYAGNDPVQSGVSYLDTYYGFGPFGFSQIPGYDMPEYAMCLNATFHASEVSKTHPCGITIFEADQNYVLQRHSSQRLVSATKNIALVIRAVYVVGNYDYTVTTQFYLDGTIETIVQASGYIQSAYYYANEGYGYKIHDTLSGSMHNHVLTFKADFDVLGSKNTMVKDSFEPATVKYKWSDKPRNTMHLVRSEVTNEAHAKMNWAPNGKEQVLILNKDEKNKYGEERGWKMMPSRGGAGMHLTVEDSSNLLKSGAFGTHQYYVTKYKDSETRVANAWNAYDPAHPIIDFDTFFDGDDLEQEDIVVWYNLGMHHVPHTGDLPNTVMTTAQSAMMITPHNLLLNEPSRAVTNQIRINYNDNGTTDVETFGAQPVSGTIDLGKVQWDAFSYSGDVSVRKFPYDPQNPYNSTHSI